MTFIIPNYKIKLFDTMKLKLFLIPVVFAFTLTYCQNNDNGNTKEDNGNNNKVTVLEVLQTTSYTYLHVDNNGTEQWLATKKTTANKGDVLYYKGEMLMTNFKSKELKRTFDKILFLDKISKTPNEEKVEVPDTHSVDINERKPNIVKEEVKVKSVEGAITIEELYKNKDKYSEKTVKVSGKVMKFNSSIMGKNWIHIQDGTEHSGDFDLTITTQEVVKEGDEVVFTGKVYLDKDFGYGYSYKLIMEEASMK